MVSSGAVLHSTLRFAPSIAGLFLLLVFLSPPACLAGSFFDIVNLGSAAASEPTSILITGIGLIAAGKLRRSRKSA